MYVTEEEYRMRLELLERYRAAASKEEKQELKIRIAIEKIRETQQYFSAYNDSGVASGFHEVIEFLTGERAEPTFVRHIVPKRNKG